MLWSFLSVRYEDGDPRITIIIGELVMCSWMRTNLVQGVVALITTGQIWGHGVGTLKGTVADPLEPLCRAPDRRCRSGQ